MATYKPTGNIYAVDNGDYSTGDKLIILDPNTYAILGDLTVTIDLPDRTVDEMHGIAYNPIDKKFYVIVEYDEIDDGNMRFLCTVDVETGVLTEIGLVGDIEQIEFNSNGTLYGVNDNSGGVEGGIYIINKKTLGKKLLVGMGDDGNDTIAYNPTDGFLYHWNDSDPFTMSKINVKTREVFSILSTGYNPDESSSGALYLADNTFLLMHDDPDVMKITTNGVGTNLGVGYSDSFVGFAQAYTFKKPKTTLATGVKCIKYGTKKTITSGSCRA
jgi:hypothetical protein